MRAKVERLNELYLAKNTEILNAFFLKGVSGTTYQLDTHFDISPATIFKRDGVVYICPFSQDFSEKYIAYPIEFKDGRYVIPMTQFGSVNTLALAFDDVAAPLGSQIVALPFARSLLQELVKTMPLSKVSSSSSLTDSAIGSMSALPMLEKKQPQHSPMDELRLVLLEAAAAIAKQGTGVGLFKSVSDDQRQVITIINAVSKEIANGQLENSQSVIHAINAQLEIQQLPTLSSVQWIKEKMPLRATMALLRSALPLIQETSFSSSQVFDN